MVRKDAEIYFSLSFTSKEVVMWRNTGLHSEVYALPLLFQMYGLIWLTQIPGKVQNVDVLVMLTSALCHDLDHPGYNNAYQVGTLKLGS